MTRTTPLRPLLGATAVAAALAACSQPPGAALVDLSGTYGQTAYNNPNQSYAGPIPSIDLGAAPAPYQPTVVYQSRPVNQSIPPIQVAQDVGLTYQDAPVQQVASLDHHIGHINAQPAYPLPELTGGYQLAEAEPQYNATDLAPGYYPTAPEPIDLPGGAGPVYTPSTIEVEPLGAIEVTSLPPQHGGVQSDVPQIYSETLVNHAGLAPQGPTVDFSYSGRSTGHGETPFMNAATPPPAAPPRAILADVPAYDGGTIWGGAPAPDYVPQAALPRPQAPVSAPYPAPFDVPGYGMFPPEGYAGDALSALRASTFTAASYRTAQLNQRYGVPAPAYRPAPRPAYRPAPPPQPAPGYVAANAPTLSGAGYVIRHGDTMYSIARRHGLKVDAIAAANGLGLSTTIYPGQTIMLPGVSAAIAPPTPPVQVPAQRYAQAAPPVAPIVTYGEPAPQVVYNTRPTNVAFETGSIGPDAAPGFGWPIHGQVYARKDAHGSVGLEIRTTPGQTVGAASAGEVRHVQDGAQGILVVIDHKGGWRSLYLGLDNVGVQPGQPVGTGAPLGVVAARQTPSVLFELRKNGVAIDPISQLAR